MPAARLVSVNVGQPRQVSWATELATSCIDKRPVDGPVAVTALGLEGDSVSDTKHHGGRLQAVYAYAQEDYDWWAGELGASVAPGAFGENLTTSGLDLTDTALGETWRVGSALLRVVDVRIPCRTFQGRMAELGFDDTAWVKRFTEVGRPGAYLSVVEEGLLSAGEAVEVVESPLHGVTVGTMFKALTTEPNLLPGLLEVEGLPPSVYDVASKRLDRRGQA